MNKKVCVSLEEITRFEDEIKFLLDDLHDNKESFRKVYDYFKERLEDLLKKLRLSQDAIEHDKVVLDGIYRKKERELDERQARAEAGAGEGASAPQVDRSILQAIERERRGLDHLHRRVSSDISACSSTLSSFKEAYRRVEENMASFEAALDSLSSNAHKAYDCIKLALTSLSLGENYVYASLSIRNIDVLSQTAEALLNCSSNASSCSSKLTSCASEFRSALEDDVSRTSYDTAEEMGYEMRKVGRFYESASASLKSGYSALMHYLSLA